MNAAPPGTNMVKTASQVRLGTSATSDQMVENKDGHKPKVELPKLDLDSPIKTLIDRTTHKLV